jgi:hypothetical protein
MSDRDGRVHEGEAGDVDARTRTTHVIEVLSLLVSELGTDLSRAVTMARNSPESPRRGSALIEKLGQAATRRRRVTSAARMGSARPAQKTVTPASDESGSMSWGHSR